MASQQAIVVKDATEIVQRLKSRLIRSEFDKRPIVILTCGIAGAASPILYGLQQNLIGSGAGKTTLAKEILRTHPDFTRLSIDEIIAARHGICNIDYEHSKYNGYQEEADVLFIEELHRRLADGTGDIILDRSFYAKEDRDEFKNLIDEAGARWVLVSLRASRDVLWERIVRRRSNGIDANSALDITRELLDNYVQGFEHPTNEDEIVVEYSEQLALSHEAPSLSPIAS